MGKTKKYKVFIAGIKSLMRRISDDNVDVFSAQSAFYIITAFIPFLAMTITLIKFFIGMSRAEITETAMNIFPSTLSEYMKEIISDLYETAPASVMSLSAVAALWSSSSAVRAVRVGLNRVYHINSDQNYFKKLLSSMAYTLLFMLVVVFSLAVLVFGNSIISLLRNRFPSIINMLTALMCFKSLFSVIIFTAIFVFMYKYLPSESENRTIRSQLPGALLASFSWVVFSYFYGLYIDNYSKYSSVYGSMAAIVLMLLWVYFCLKMVLMGAELNEYFKDASKPQRRIIKEKNSIIHERRR